MTIYVSYTSLLLGLSFVHNVFTRNGRDGTFLRSELRWNVCTRRAEMGRSYAPSRDGTFLRANRDGTFLRANRDGTFLRAERR